MKFVIASIVFLESVGFDVEHFRKNVDGTKALIHSEYAKVLVPDIETNENITIYESPSAVFDNLLQSEEWADASI